MKGFLHQLSILFLVLVLFTLQQSEQVQADFEINQSASIVIGQQDFTSSSGNQGGTADVNTHFFPTNAAVKDNILVIADYSNNRVLIYNSIPTSNNAAADVVIGQTDFTSTDANQGGSADANTLHAPYAVAFAGEKLLISDWQNNRILIYNSLPTTNNASADVVIGQTDFTSTAIDQGGSAGANTLDGPIGIAYDSLSGKIAVSDWGNSRVLIYNEVPDSNNASADVVVGQTNFSNTSGDKGGSLDATTLDNPYYTLFADNKLIISDTENNRVLIYNTIPTTNNAAADVVIGQVGMTSSFQNQGGSIAANTLSFPGGIGYTGTQLMVSDTNNYRLLIYNGIPTSNDTSAVSVLGQPDFEHGDQNQNKSVGPDTLAYIEGSPIYSEGKLFVVDSSSNRVLIFNDPDYTDPDSSSPATSNQPAVAGLPSAAMPPGCDRQPPLVSPHIFQTQVSSNKVKLFFTPGSNDSTNWIVAYGYEFDHQVRFGTEMSAPNSVDVQNLDINDLSPNTEYFFTVRGQNGCAPGNWSSVIKVKTNHSFFSRLKLFHF